jgi:hypothetical protein
MQRTVSSLCRILGIWVAVASDILEHYSLLTCGNVIPPPRPNSHPQIGELRLLLGREHRLDLRIGRVELLADLRADVGHRRVDFGAVAFDDLLDLRFLLRREGQLVGEAVGHAGGGEAAVARGEASRPDEVQVVPGHTDENVGNERDDDDRDGRGAGVTRH